MAANTLFNYICNVVDQLAPYHSKTSNFKFKTKLVIKHTYKTIFHPFFTDNSRECMLFQEKKNEEKIKFLNKPFARRTINQPKHLLYSSLYLVKLFKFSTS